MRNLAGWFMATVFCASVTPAMAVPITIDFEGFSGGDIIIAGTDLGGGLTFDKDLRIDESGLLAGPPATTGNVAFAPAPPFFQGDDVTGSFGAAVSNLKIGAGDLGFDPDTVTLTAFDDMMNILGTDSFTSRAAQFLEVNVTGITSFLLEFDDVRPPDGTGSGGFDNITFDVVVVPVPPSLSLLLVGLAGLGLDRSRQKSI